MTGRLTLFLSQPNPPRMSGASAKLHGCYLQHALHLTEYDSRSVAQQGQHGNRRYAYDGWEHSFRSYKTSNLILEQPDHSDSPRSLHEQHGPIVNNFHGSMGAQDASHFVRPMHSPQQARCLRLPAQLVTSRFESAHAMDQRDSDEIIDNDQDEESDRVATTKDEDIAAKRKKKRFRLNHTQTRFLLSEFAKQVHPDAARRERLARKVPGLCARQVQVWFQNRRAKLKRMMSEGRDRKTISHGLPANFNITQALHSPFPGQHPGMGGTIPEMGSYQQHYESTIRQLTTDTLQNVPSYEHYGQPYVTVSGMSSAMGAHSFPSTQPDSEDLSTSSVGNMFLNQQGSYSQSRRTPSGLSGSGQPGYVLQMQAPRIFSNDVYATTLDESAGAHAHTITPYLSLGHVIQPFHYPESASSFSEQHQGPCAHGPSSAAEAHFYGSGFSC